MTTLQSPTEVLGRRMAEAADLVTVALDALLPRADGPESRLTEAMRYVALGPGRRLHAFFAMEAARMFDVEARPVLRSACALECVYACSRAHDDVATLGGGDERRGRPTVAMAYDAVTALLAGEALQTAAFEIMSHPDTHAEAWMRVELVRRLAAAAGAKGLVGGRMLDRLGLGADLRTVARMQRLKTGSLIAFAFEIPLLLAGAPAAERHALLAFAHDFGLAWQIAEDLRAADETAPFHKPSIANEKSAPNASSPRASLLTLLGPEGARERVRLLAGQSKDHLEIFGGRAAWLRASVDFVLDQAVDVPI